MNTQLEMKRQNIEKTLGKLEWLLARSEQANCRYSRAQMEAFAILQDSFRERLEHTDVMAAERQGSMGAGICHA